MGRDERYSNARHEFANREQTHQTDFGRANLRKRWFSDVEILRQNTSNAGRWLAKSGTKNPYREGPLGVIKVGAYADIILVEGNPLADVSVFLDYDKNVKVDIKDGDVYQNTL